MQIDIFAEARRQAEICNACRYCEGFCSVFPALHAERSFTDGDLTQLANLCHNCRGCYYACQYTTPHEFDLNLPGVLAEARHQSWKDHAWPRGIAPLLDRSGVAIAGGLVLGLTLFLALAQNLSDGAGFYAHMSHALMVGIFAPVFLLPLATLGVSLRRFWRSIDGPRFHLSDLWEACRSAAQMRNLSGGHGDGCNFEDEDRFSHARRHAHQAVLWGFLLCFAATGSGTVLHYVFGLQAPYGVISLPKAFGLPGGVLLSLGALTMAWLKLKADRHLGAVRIWGAEMAFVLLLAFVAVSGLALFAATGSGLVGPLLATHLAGVATLFLMTPYSKMAHGFYRMASLTRDAARKRLAAT